MSGKENSNGQSSHIQEIPRRLQAVSIEAAAAAPQIGTERVNMLHVPNETIFGLAGPIMRGLGWSVWPQERNGRRMPSLVEGRAVRWGEYADRLPSEDEMTLFCRDAGQANVAIALGFASGRAFAVDIDCMDAEVSARVQAIAASVLGQTPFIRIGRAPKAALLYRYAEGPPRSRSVRFRDHEDCSLEILGEGKPLTMHGLHHTTGRWFMWPEENPLSSGPEAAPEVGAAQVEEFLRAVEREFPFVRPSSPVGARTAQAATVRGEHGGGIVMPARLDGPKLDDGREEYLKNLAWSVVRLNGHALLRAHQDGTLGTAKQQVVAAVCQQFEEDCEMSGRWNSGLPEAAGARVGSAVLKLVNGDMTPAPERSATASGTGLASKEFDTAQFRNPPPPRSYALHGLPVGKVGVLVSAGGTGKSTLALGLAASLVTGRNLFGLLEADPPKSKVMYVSVEDDAQRIWELMRDIDDAADGDVLSMPDFSQMFRLFALDDEGFSIGSWKPCIGILPSVEMLELGGIIADAKPALVILDTLNRALGGLPENDNNAMSGTIGTLERAVKPARAACLVLHHTSKGAALGGIGDIQQAARGAGAIVDNARWVSNLTGMTEEEASATGVPQDERSQWVRWTNSKANGVRPFEAKWLRRGHGGVLKAAAPYGHGKQGMLNRLADAGRRRKKDMRHD